MRAVWGQQALVALPDSDALQIDLPKTRRRSRLALLSSITCHMLNCPLLMKYTTPYYIVQGLGTGDGLHGGKPLCPLRTEIPLRCSTAVDEHVRRCCRGKYVLNLDPAGALQPLASALSSPDTTQFDDCLAVNFVVSESLVCSSLIWLRFSCPWT